MSPRSLRVLLVEDDAVSASALAMILRRRGFEVTQVGTIAEGFNRLAEQPDFLILDLMLPDGDGQTILQHIRTQNLSTRVLVTTAASDPNRLRAVRDLKPDLLLLKPIDITRLLGMMEPGN
jgi:DNA-binding response OmpR family regulator